MSKYLETPAGSQDIGRKSATQNDLKLWDDISLPAAPFLRWAGGKRWLVSYMTQLQPKSFKRYFEPFLGSGAMLLSVPTQVERFGSDTNKDLISAFVAVRDCPEEIIRQLAGFGSEKSDYLSLREKYNTDGYGSGSDPCWRASVFIYLNRTSFNGLYRVNRSGEFNVPWGGLQNPLEKIPNQIRSASENLFSREGDGCRASFEVNDYRSVLEKVGEGDWVFLDPPYAPLSRTSDFVGYTPEGFGEEDQRELRDLALESSRRGAKIMISNSDTSFTRDLYKDSPFRIRQFPVNRKVGASASSRIKVNELVVTTYD